MTAMLLRTLTLQVIVRGVAGDGGSVSCRLMPVVLERREAGGSRVTYFCEFCLRQLRMVTPKRRLNRVFK